MLLEHLINGVELEPEQGKGSWCGRCTKERKPQLWIRVVYTPVGGWQTAPAGVLAPRARPRVGCFPEVGSLNLTASLGRVMIPFNG